MPSRRRAGTAMSARGVERCRVVFEPRQPARSVHPEAAQESESRRRWRRCRTRARACRQRPTAHRPTGARGRRDEDDGADVAEAEDGPGRACATAPRPSARRRPARRQRSNASRRCVVQARTDAGHAHFLGGRRGYRGVEQVAGEPHRLRGAFVRGAFDGGPPRGCPHGGEREDGDENQRGVDRDEQRHRDAASSRTRLRPCPPKPRN